MCHSYGVGIYPFMGGQEKSMKEPQQITNSCLRGRRVVQQGNSQTLSRLTLLLSFTGIAENENSF